MAAAMWTPTGQQLALMKGPKLALSPPALEGDGLLKVTPAGSLTAQPPPLPSCQRCSCSFILVFRLANSYSPGSKLDCSFLVESTSPSSLLMCGPISLSWRSFSVCRSWDALVCKLELSLRRKLPDMSWKISSLL